MIPGKYDMKLYRGDSAQFVFYLWQDVNESVTVDLTGATAACQIRDKSAGTKIVDLTTAITLPNIVRVTMTPAMYSTCPPTGVWDLQITFPDGQVHTPIAGAVVVTADVTQSQPMALMMEARAK